MPNPVVHFEVSGANPGRLREFYSRVFGWDFAVLPGGYALVETESHIHDETTGETTYTGPDAFMNEGVVIGQEGGQPVWRFKADGTQRPFVPGIGGGVAQGEPRVSFSIQVKDLESTLAAVEAAGGRAVVAPHEAAPNVWVAEFADPEGNVLGLIRA